MDNIYKAVQLTIDSQNLALSKTPTHVYIANQYVDTNDTPLITAPFIIQKALENGTGVVDIVSSTIGSIYEVRLLCDAEVLISGYFYMPPMNVNFSELELYTSYPPRTPPVVNEFWQKTENFILEKTNTLLNFVQVFNSLSSMRLSLGYLEELLTTKKSNLVGAINEVYKKYEGVGSLYEKNVAAAGAGAEGWTALLVADASGMTQQQVNDKTAIFYNTVADMVADTKLKAGKAVITHGYWSANDGGGARYLIKDTATDYSIPVANNLHAVFADSFDIRKFGIRNSATLNQTKEIERMCRYADISGTYEIDFQNFNLQVPKTRTLTNQWGTDGWGGKTYGGIMAMAFEKVHKLKNLFITHDKTVRLENAMCMILFAPLVDAPYEQYFKLENVTFDAWVDDYQKFTDNYLGNADGFRIGFVATTKKGAVGISDYQVTPTNYSFEFNNVYFKSPAYSYNIWTTLHTQTTKFNNLNGEYLGLYLCHCAQSLIGSNMSTIWRDDLKEQGRALVSNALHEEFEFGGATVTKKMIDVSNISSIRKTTGKAWSAFVYHGLVQLTIDSVSFNNMEGYVGFGAYKDDGKNINNYINVNTVKYTNCTRDNSLQLMNCSVNGELYIDNWKFLEDPPRGSYGSAIYLMMNLYTKKIVIRNSEIYRSPTTPYLNTDRVIDEMVLENTKIAGGAWIDDQRLTIKKITARNVTLLDNCLTFLRGKFETIDLDNITYAVNGDPIRNIIKNEGSNTAVANIVNMSVPRQYNRDFPPFAGNLSVNLKNSNFITNISYDNAKVSLNIENTKLRVQFNYDPPAIATATTHMFGTWLTGGKVGDTVVVSFNQKLQGTRVWGEVTDKDWVAIYIRNDTGATVDLPSGTFTIKVV